MVEDETKYIFKLLEFFGVIPCIFDGIDPGDGDTLHLLFEGHNLFDFQLFP